VGPPPVFGSKSGSELLAMIRPCSGRSPGGCHLPGRYQGQRTLVSPSDEQPQQVQGGLPSCRVLRMKLSCPGASCRLGGCAHLGSAPSVPPARGTEVKGQPTVAASQRQVAITFMCRSVHVNVQARRCAVGDRCHVQAAMARSGGVLR